MRIDRAIHGAQRRLTRGTAVAVWAFDGFGRGDGSGPTHERRRPPGHSKIGGRGWPSGCSSDAGRFSDSPLVAWPFRRPILGCASTLSAAAGLRTLTPAKSSQRYLLTTRSTAKTSRCSSETLPAFTASDAPGFTRSSSMHLSDCERKTGRRTGDCLRRVGIPRRSPRREAAWRRIA